MRLKALALVIVSALTLSVSAQEVSDRYVDNQPGKNVSFSKNKASDNWFISLQGGATIVQDMKVLKDMESPKHPDLKFADRLGASGSLGIGKWHDPYFGTRLSIDYNYLMDSYGPLKPKAEGDWRNQLLYTHSINPHFDMMFNMSNYFAPYRADRVFNFVVFAGAGYQGTFALLEKSTQDANIDFWKAEKDDAMNHAITINMGTEFQFRLGRRASFVLAPQVTLGQALVSTKPSVRRASNDLIGQVRAGFTFDAGRPEWDAVVPMDEALVNDLQAQVNRLRAENAELAKRPKECPEVAPKTITKEVAAKEIERAVYFRIGSATVDRNQKADIYTVAEFAKTNNLPIVVVGYADADTGSANWNMTLSERRAREVARILTDEYGVAADRIQIEYKGDTEQPYGENVWNRVVIMTAK